MAVLFKSNEFSLLDHGHKIYNLYRYVSSDSEITSYSLLSGLFSIKRNESKEVLHRKRSRGFEESEQEALKVCQIYEKFIKEVPEEIKTNNLQYNLMETSTVRDLSKKLLERTVFNHSGLNGGNNSDRPLKCSIRDEWFLLPPHSRFFCGCVKEQCAKLDGSKFDILIADPPWWNKYIRRLKTANDKLSYKMMYNEDIAAIPVKNLLSTNCLVAVWCTNSPANISAVTDLIFPAWGVEYITTWYWMKVTVDFQPLCSFGQGCKKQPYERLIIGKVGEIKELPKSHMLMSIPSALHSHKPPLLDVLSPYLNVETPNALELFARYLLPNTTSVGFEPLKWQHISLYEKVS